MDLADYYQMLRRHWLLVSLLTLLGIIAASVATLLVNPTYTSRTQLFVSIQNSGSVQELAQGNTFGQSRVQSYVRTATTPSVLQPVVDSLNLETTPAELAGRVDVTADLNTVLINVDVSDQSPVRAAAIAQAVSDSLIQAVDRLERPSADEPSPVRLSIVTPATAPAEPSSPNPVLNISIGALLGLMLGLATAILISIFDTKIRTEADVKARTEAAILGGIGLDNDAVRKPLLTQAPPQGPRSESFRQIRTNLQFAHVGRSSNSILVTSSLPGEGKSTTAINLAIAMSQAGQRVVLVDADLRRPMVAEYLGLERNAGLTTALLGDAGVQDLLQPWGDDELFVLASGAIPPNPSELLGSQSMDRLIAELSADFDTVIIDAPPLLPVTDAAVLAQRVGGVIVVVARQALSVKELDKSLAALSLVKADLLGIVMNKMSMKQSDVYSYSYSSDVSKVDPSSSTGMSRRGSNRLRGRSPERSYAPSDYS